ncbi:hypothetical protein [Clostridium pasteurianum]|uniref:Uncharacterized protein n=1 Tax=Clostridium pasteurianum BC1 TaxID=86416 RepID=R4K113_CLOPA|nr:hypothetical protein [Clostridium pasteurianum]AGK96782.1 hypothetical protein Clopa_1882 [Clostridium pasteurianum BC1]
MEFSNKEILRAKRDLENIIDDIFNCDSIYIYDINLKRLIKILKDNNVLNTITNPYFNVEINFNEIEYQENINDWIEFNIPEDIELEIAYVLQRLQEVLYNDFNILNFTHMVFKMDTYNGNIKCWNNNILRPCLRELLIKIQDLIEDEVTGKDMVDSSRLNIYNISNVSVSNNSNLAIGENIKQDININELFNKLLNTANLINNDEEKNRVIQCINEMKDNNGKKSLLDKYNKFIESAANHMTLFTPLIPLLTLLLTNIK